MMGIFDMSDLCYLTYYLGIEVDQTKDGILLTQAGYAQKILEVAGMAECNSTLFPMQPKIKLNKDEGDKPYDATTYRRIIGSIRYLIYTRPDLSYSVGVVSNGEVLGYSDNSNGNGLDDGRGATGLAFYYSGNLVTWASQKQRTVALSLCEDEFMAAAAAVCQALWLRNLIADLLGKEAQMVTLLVDNEAAISLMKNPVFHGRSKHIDTRYHFIRECVERSQICVKHVSGSLQKADILTKSLGKLKLCEMRRLIGVHEAQVQANITGESVG
ncbi:putative RNA-directed DNA polymerase [Helianthus annuus]|nr:putative RNA-directed DNA polymerase [Helianthus annuus]KAJ0552211.1 putative RNA-directed DNA polymerase [Helianthus annuus]KAJ0717912.1 putative RNA-directed DNA polymerase [Helianthus annuus]KAJ0721148.1 putative RNA-directed DNA polymerase [Helianthus annuus]